MKTRLTLAACLLLALMLGLQWSRMEQQQQELTLLREDLGSLTRALKTLERAPLSAAARAPSLPLPPPVAPTAHAQARATPDPEPEESLPDERPRPPRPQELLAHLESAWQTEAADSGWASRAQREVRDNLSAMLPPEAIVRSLDCKASLCRLEVAYTDEAQFRQVMGNPAAPAMLWKGASMTHIETDPVRGSVTAVTYLSHPEHALPLPPTANN